MVGLSKMEVRRSFGYQPPKDYNEEEHPYFGKLLTYHELETQLSELKVDEYLTENRRINHWYRYIEAQIWADPRDMMSRFKDLIEVEPESWTYDGVTYLQNYKKISRIRQ